MKRIIIGISLAFCLLSYNAFATGDNDVTPVVENSFKTEFSNVENVKWRNEEGIYAANFLQNGFRVEAYFEETGELIGSIRNIIFEQLPLSVLNSVNKKYNGAAIYELIEFNIYGETYYRMTVELPTKILKIRCGITGDIFVQTKTKK
jgi:hypothetical protein